MVKQIYAVFIILAIVISLSISLVGCGGGGPEVSSFTVPFSLSSRSNSADDRQILAAGTGNAVTTSFIFEDVNRPVTITSVRLKKASGSTASLVGNIEIANISIGKDYEHAIFKRVTGEEILFDGLDIQLFPLLFRTMEFGLGTPPEIAESGKTLRLKVAEIGYRLASGENKTWVLPGELVTPEYLLHRGMPYVNFDNVNSSVSSTPDHQVIGTLGFSVYGQGELLVTKTALTVEGTAFSRTGDWRLVCTRNAYLGNKTDKQVVFPMSLLLTGLDKCQIIVDTTSVLPGTTMRLSIKGVTGYESPENGLTYSDYAGKYTGTIAPYRNFNELFWYK